MLVFLFYLLFSFSLAWSSDPAVKNVGDEFSCDSHQLHLLVQEALQYQDIFAHSTMSEHFSKKIMPRRTVKDSELDSDESALNVRFSHIAGSAALVASFLYFSSSWFRVQVDSKCADCGAFLKSIMDDDSKNKTSGFFQNVSSYFPEFLTGPASTLLSFGSGRLAMTFFCGYQLYAFYLRVRAACKTIAWLKKYIEYVVQFLNSVHNIFSFFTRHKCLEDQIALLKKKSIYKRCSKKLKCLQLLLSRAPQDDVAHIAFWLLSADARKIYVVIVDLQKELGAMSDSLASLDAQLCAS